MRQRLGRLPSPALIIAAIALVFALGGTSVAAVAQLARGSVGTPHLKANAVTGAKIQNSSITSADVRNGSLLRGDFRRGQLPVGPVGAQGPQGPPGLTAREQVSAETPQNSTASRTITATCPVGKKVIGGGVELSGPGRARVTATENKPSGDNAWEGEAFEAVATNAAWKLVVHAICATVAG